MAKNSLPYITEPKVPAYLFKRYKRGQGNCLNVIIFIIGEVWLTVMNIPVIILDIIYACIYYILMLCKSGGFLKELTPKLGIHSRKYRQIGLYCFLEDLQSDYQHNDEDIAAEGKEHYEVFLKDILTHKGSIESDFPLGEDGDNHGIKVQQDVVELGQLKQNILARLGWELFHVCKANQVNKLKHILNRIPSDIDVCLYQCELQRNCGWEVKYKPSSDKKIKMTLLHVALLRGSLDVALELIELRNSCMISSRGLHCVTSLHLAILQSNAAVVRKIVNSLNAEELENILYICSTTRSLRSSSKGAQLPLCLAVLSGNSEIVDTLFESKVNLNKQDQYGHNVFHTLVLMSLDQKETALLMFDKIVGYVTEWWKETTKDATAPSFGPASSRLEGLSCLFKQKTKTENLTPLGLAAYVGASAIMDRILNTEEGYRFTIMECGLKDIVCYDVSEIDTTIDEDTTAPSILEILVGARTDNALKCMDIDVIDKLIINKWNNYFMYYFLVWLLYFIFLIVFTVNLQNFTSENKSNSTYTSVLWWTNREDGGIFWVGIFVTGCIFYFFILGITILLSVIVEIARRQFRSIAFVLAWRRLLLSTVVVIVCLTIILGFVFRLGPDLFQRSCLVIFLVCAWALLIFFMQGFRPTAIFSIMLERILFRDVLLFAMCYTCIAIGFAAAFYINMRFSPNPIDEFKDPGHALFTLFRIMLGLSETDEMFDINRYSLATYLINVVLFISYVAVTTILLLNMLIASMSYTLNEIKMVGLLWKKLRTFNMHIVEHVLPLFILLYSSNYPTKTYNLREVIDGKWKVYKRIIHYCKV